jgi:hypothetical protein
MLVEMASSEAQMERRSSESRETSSSPGNVAGVHGSGKGRWEGALKGFLPLPLSTGHAL